MTEPSASAPARANALSALDTIRKEAAGRQVVVFLDYDGTLTPIVDRPERAFLSSAMREALQQLAHHYSTAIVTGRSYSTVFDFVKLKELYYAGSHGFDIRGPDGKAAFSIATDYRPALEKTVADLRAATSHIPGAELEDNVFCCSVHYRHVQPSRIAEVERIVDDYIAAHTGALVKKHGKMVFELRPNVEWSKGHAVRWLMDHMPSSPRASSSSSCSSVSHISLSCDGSASSVASSVSSVASCTTAEGGEDKHHAVLDAPRLFPVYLGDDVSDEDGFQAIRDHGAGAGILVAAAPRHTKAQYTLRDPVQVQAFLQSLAQQAGSQADAEPQKDGDAAMGAVSTVTAAAAAAAGTGTGSGETEEVPAPGSAAAPVAGDAADGDAEQAQGAGAGAGAGVVAPAAAGAGAASTG